VNRRSVTPTGFLSKATSLQLLDQATSGRALDFEITSGANYGPFHQTAAHLHVDFGQDPE
jgi:hypothetical protein